MFKKPQTGDKGTVFWPALEDNFQKLNDHTHNGVNSARLASSAIVSTTQAILSAAWSSVGDGVYRQLVTLPGTMLYDEYVVMFKRTAAPKDILLLGTEKVSSNTYYVYINDNSVDVTAYYVS